MHKKLFAILLLTLPAAPALAVPYTGSLGFGDTVTDTVTSGSGWASGSVFETDFWSFTGAAGDEIAIEAAALTASFDAGLSLYLGLDSTQFLFFDNMGDAWGTVDYQAQAPDGLLDAFILPETGEYTIAVGGNTAQPLVGEPPYGYELSLSLVDDAAEVPVPATLPLLLGGVVTMAGLRRSRR